MDLGKIAKSIIIYIKVLLFIIWWGKIRQLPNALRTYAENGIIMLISANYPLTSQYI
jgi:hypothetical protein